MLNNPLRSSRLDEIPLTFSQKRVWFLQNLYKDDVMYNVPMCFKIKGFLDADALRGSLNDLVDRHEALRFRLRISKDKTPVQVIDHDACVDIEQIDLRNDSGSDKHDRAWKIARETVVRPFHLGCDLMLRALLVMVERDESILLFVKHHLINDDWSRRLFLEEFMALYSAKICGVKPSLPQLPWSYSDYARKQVLSITEEVITGRRNYWKSFFRDNSSSRLKEEPIAPQSADDRCPSYGVHVQSVPSVITGQCRIMAKNLQNTLFGIFLAALSLLASHLYGLPKMMLCIANANRRDPGAEKVIGCFFTNVILPVNIPSDCKVSELAGNIRADFIHARNAQNMPFEMFAGELALDCTRRFKPPYPIYISYRSSMHDTAFRLPDTQIEPVMIPTGRYTHEDLALNIWEKPSEEGFYWEIQWLWKTDLFDEPSIIKASSMLEALLCEIAKDDQADVQSILARIAIAHT